MSFDINDLVAKRTKPRKTSDRSDIAGMLGEQPETANLQPGPSPAPTPTPTPQPKRKGKPTSAQEPTVLN